MVLSTELFSSPHKHSLNINHVLRTSIHRQDPILPRRKEALDAIALLQQITRLFLLFIKTADHVYGIGKWYTANRHTGTHEYIKRQFLTA